MCVCFSLCKCVCVCDLQEYNEIKVQEGAKVVLAPSFGVTRAEVRSKITGKVTISDASTLILDGDITINNLVLDGTLIVKAAAGASVRLEDVRVNNKGWSFIPNAPSDKGLDEKYLIRGYTLKKTEQVEVVVAKGEETLTLNASGSAKYTLQGGQLLPGS